MPGRPAICWTMLLDSLVFCTDSFSNRLLRARKSAYNLAFANVREESKVLWARLLAYVTGTANQELLLRSEHLAAENRMLRGQIRGRLLLRWRNRSYRTAYPRRVINSVSLRCKAPHESAKSRPRVDSAWCVG